MAVPYRLHSGKLRRHYRHAKLWCGRRQGINCPLGPKEIHLSTLCSAALPCVVPAGMPVFVKPNAGLPNLDGSYDIVPSGVCR